MRQLVRLSLPVFACLGLEKFHRLEVAMERALNSFTTGKGALDGKRLCSVQMFKRGLGRGLCLSFVDRTI